MEIQINPNHRDWYFDPKQQEMIWAAIYRYLTRDEQRDFLKRAPDGVKATFAQRFSNVPSKHGIVNLSVSYTASVYVEDGQGRIDMNYLHMIIWTGNHVPASVIKAEAKIQKDLKNPSNEN